MGTIAPAKKTDKYAAVVDKYDWHSPIPPQGYIPGISRGAKGFVTSSEISGINTQVESTRLDELQMLAELDRIDERSHRKRKRFADAPTNDLKQRSTDEKPSVTLSVEDLATIGSSASSLVTRKARTEELDVEETIFGADGGITLSDLQRSKNHATSRALMNLLDMGSESEQSTWITRARIYVEMGKHKKALETLRLGCEQTGKMGPAIWIERLSLLERQPTEMREIAQAAVMACPSSEALWLRVIRLQATHQQLEWVQKAVMACPNSEELWGMLLRGFPSPEDQRRLVRKALETSPTLARLWARLVRMESTYEAGHKIFKAVAVQHPSFALTLEACKYEEEVCDKGGDVKAKHICRYLMAAKQRYLVVEQVDSRQAWIDAAVGAASEGWYLTSAYLLMCLTAHKTEEELRLSLDPHTWLQDLFALLPLASFSSSSVLYALWTAVLEVASVLLSDTPLKNEYPDEFLNILSSAVYCATEEEVEYFDAWKASNPSRNPKKAAQNPNTTRSTVIFSELFERTLMTFDVHRILMCVSKGMFKRGRFRLCRMLLTDGVQSQAHDGNVYCALAKVLAAEGNSKGAEDCLRHATQNLSITTNMERVWVKLAIHVRSLRGQEETIPILEAGLLRLQLSERLWLMRLQAACEAIRVLPRSTVPGDTNAPTQLETLSQQCSDLAQKALLPGRNISFKVWCYVAVQVESGVLQKLANARATLLQAAMLFQQESVALAAIGLAKAKVELLHNGTVPALEEVLSTLQRQPKERGMFVNDVSELVAMSIDLAVPSHRGRAAQTAMKVWRAVSPLVLCSLGRLYHAAGNHSKALVQVQKAIEESGGRCGDALALLLSMTAQLAYAELLKPEWTPFLPSEHPTEPLATTTEPGTSHSAEHTINAATRMAMDHYVLSLAKGEWPNSGPLWISIAKESDPTNVTLLGYRRTVLELLQDTAALNLLN